MFKFLFKIGQRYRNPSITKWFSFLKETEGWSRIQLEEYQLKQLQNIVAKAYNYSTFYKNRFDELGVKPKDIQQISDISKLPITTKDDLIKKNKEIHTNLVFKKKFKANTSGSTGTSLAFYRNESADSFNRASIIRGYSWYGVNYWDKNGYFWGFNFNKKEKLKTIFLDFLQNRFRIFNYEKNEFKRFVKKLQSATYIHGYSSAIYHTAKLINQQKLTKPLQLKMVKGTSEKIFEGYQDEVKKAFGSKIISEYGATESGIIAFECKEGNMHINMEGVVVEEVNGEILVTNIQMESFPLIRYKLEDYVLLADKDKKCACGMEHQILEEVTGRIGEDVYGKENVYPSFTFYYIFKNLDKKQELKLNYQVIQSKKGYLLFKTEQKLNPEELNLLQDEIQKYFTTDIDFDILDNQIIKIEGKKMRSFISEINKND